MQLGVLVQVAFWGAVWGCCLGYSYRVTVQAHFCEIDGRVQGACSLGCSCRCCVGMLFGVLLEVLVMVRVLD